MKIKENDISKEVVKCISLGYEFVEIGAVKFMSSLSNYNAMMLTLNQRSD